MNICPCCNDTLLRSIYHKKIIWFCPSCRQEMPNIKVVHKSSKIQEDIRIKNVNQGRLSELLSHNNANFKKKII